MKIVTKPKLWGYSLGIIIPKSVIKEGNISLDTEITVEIKKDNPIKEIFGILKDWKIDSQKVKDKSRKEEELSEKRK